MSFNYYNGETMKHKIKYRILILIFGATFLFNSSTMAEVIQSNDGEYVTNLTPAAPNPNTNSGLRPEYTMNPLQNFKPVAPNDILPNLTATSAIVIEAKTGRILYQREADKKMFPASTTKMMTLIMALEYGKLDEIVTVSNNAAGTEGSSLYLEAGEKMPLGELLYGMMMLSGNDSAVAIGEHVDGNAGTFATHMTNRAKELGAENTNFVNPNGLPDDNHYTTAHDLAILTAHGYTLDKFEDIVSSKEKTFQWVHDPNHLLRNENQMLWLYEGGNGVKTGYTKAAGRCLVSSSKRNGVHLIAVVLDSIYLWNDSIMLLDYGFSQVESGTIVKADEIIKNVPVNSGNKKDIPVKTSGEIILPKFKATDAGTYTINYELPNVLEAPIKKGDTVGKVHVLYNDREVAVSDIVAADEAAAVEKKSFFSIILDNVNRITNWCKTFLSERHLLP